MEDIFFKDRVDAGERLAEKLIQKRYKNPVVLALPRGGVTLGNVIAKRLNCPLDLLITRKIGHPLSPEYAIASVTISGEVVENEAETIQVDRRWFEGERKKQQEEAERRHGVYLGGRKTLDLKDKTVIIVDDGVATGLTMMAGIKEVNSKSPAKIVVAVPVIPFETYETLLKLVNEVVYVSAPDDFIGAIGLYYRDFPQVTDDEVIKLLENS
jgi:predicted phosphoribosyltransferase